VPHEHGGLSVAEHLDRADAARDALTREARGELAEHVAALKVVATDVALDVTSTVFEVTGARATRNAVGLDRFWRNVRTHTLHDPWPTSAARWATTTSTAPTRRSRSTRDPGGP
jgi:alkylation response protein AidB-like acyl-CoA dehydrogenase